MRYKYIVETRRNGAWEPLTHTDDRHQAETWMEQLADRLRAHHVEFRVVVTATGEVVRSFRTHG